MKCGTPCQTYAPKSSRYRVSLLLGEIIFNHEIECDVCWIDHEPILYLIDPGTRYSMAKYMKIKTAENAWDFIIEFWVTVFTGFPNIVASDLQSCFRSQWVKTT